MADQEDQGEDKERGTGRRRGSFEEAGASLLQGLGQLLDRGMVEVEAAARTGKAHVELMQAERDRDALLRRLGRAVFEAARGGGLEIPGQQDLLREVADAEDRVDALKEGLRRGGAG